MSKADSSEKQRTKLHTLSFTLLSVLVIVSGIYYVYHKKSISISTLFGTEKVETNLTIHETDDPFELGEYYFSGGGRDGSYDLEKARHYYTEALRGDPAGNPRTWYQLGRIDFVENDMYAALYKFKKQIEYFDDKVPEVYYMLGLTYGYLARETEDTEDWQRAEEAFETFIPYAPMSPWPRVDLAWVYFSQGKYEEMLPVLERGLAHQPEQPWLLNTYGLALLNTGERARAHEQFLKAREAAAPLTAEEWGRAYSGNNPERWGDGLEEFRNSIEHNLEISK